MRGRAMPLGRRGSRQPDGAARAKALVRRRNRGRLRLGERESSAWTRREACMPRHRMGIAGCIGHERNLITKCARA